MFTFYLEATLNLIAVKKKKKEKEKKNRKKNPIYPMLHMSEYKAITRYIFNNLFKVETDS